MARISTLTRTLTIAGLVGGMTASLAEAAPMSPVQVRDAAEHFASSRASLTGRAVVELQPLAWEAAEPVFYLASLEGSGWILASADDAVLPVIGWSDQPLPAGELPPAMVDWLMGEEEHVLKLRADGVEDATARGRWENLLSAGDAPAAAPLCTEPGEDVAPLIEANWSQGATWNTDCPADAAGPGGHTYVGCVGVALAQVLDYWNWPEQGENVQSYEHSVYGQITVDFSQVTYDWSAITPSGTNDAVRELLFHSGVSVRMNYGPYSSSAQSSMVVTALRQYFRYQDTARMVWRSTYDAATWQGMLHTELAAGRPVVYRGQGPTGGHAFNVDGVQDSTWFHINWGWGGSHNGYFELTDLTPGTKNYNSVQGAIIGIAPEGVAVNHAPVVAGLFLECQENQTISQTLTGYDVDGDALTFRVDGQFLAGNVWTWTPPLNTSGTFTFQYQACDGGGCSAPADIVVVVHGVNQLPTVPDVTVQGLTGQAISVTLGGSDPDGDSLTYTVAGQPIYGNVWTWTPQDAGTFTFDYMACDGSGCGAPATITVAVESSNHAPVVVDMTVESLEDETVAIPLAGYDADGDALVYWVNGQQLDGGTFTWTPAADFNGQATFTFQASDGIAGSQTATLTLNILAVNDAPVAESVTLHLLNPGRQHVQLVAWDIDRDDLTYVVDGQAISGSVFVVDVDSSDTDLTYEYYVRDGHAKSDTMTVQLTFAPKGGSKPQHDPLGVSINSEEEREARGSALPAATALLPAYPNPFNPATTLVVELAAAEQVRLAVYNIAGQLVAELASGVLEAGRHELRWDASRQASGAYLAALQTSRGLETQILQLVK